MRLTTVWLMFLLANLNACREITRESPAAQAKRENVVAPAVASTNRCTGQLIPPCPYPPCAVRRGIGDVCPVEGEWCGDESGDSFRCTNSIWRIESIHPPLQEGCPECRFQRTP